MDLLRAKLLHPAVFLQKAEHPERLSSDFFSESVNDTGEFLSYPRDPQTDEEVGTVELDVLDDELETVTTDEVETLVRVLELCDPVDEVVEEVVVVDDD